MEEKCSDEPTWSVAPVLLAGLWLYLFADREEIEKLNSQGLILTLDLEFSLILDYVTPQIS